MSTHRAVVQALLGFGCRAAVDRLRRPEPTGEPHADPPAFILDRAAVPRDRLRAGDARRASAAGCKLVIMYKWDPERALELIERERVTNFVGVPTQSWDLLESPRLRRLRHVEPASASAAAARRRRPSW